MSISMIRAQEPQRVVDAGHAVDGKASALDNLIGEQVRAANAMRESWFGRAATAAATKAYRNIQQEYLEHEKLAALAAETSVDASISLWNPYGTQLVNIANSDTRGLGGY